MTKTASCTPTHTVKTNMRKLDANLLVAYGEQIGAGLRIRAALAAREIERRRREISALERLSARNIVWHMHHDA